MSDTKFERNAGILMPVSSLPSPYGIGTFGKDAYDFVTFVKECNHKYWQVLPLGPTTYGDSPYQSYSAFAGNPYFVDLDMLIEAGFLLKSEVISRDWGDGIVPVNVSEDDAVNGRFGTYRNGNIGDERYVSYEKIYNNRFDILRIAYNRFKAACAESKKTLAKGLPLYKQFDNFVKDNVDWLEDYALFMAVKDRFEGVEWTKWAEDIRLRWNNAMDYYREELYFDIEFQQYMQFKFYEQWMKLKSYANSKGIQIIGDIPIYVAMDSADAWAHPELFQLDQDNVPLAVAGCPPDGFSATGQLWGNPLYRWDYHRNTGYQWWISRMSYCFRLYDVVRIDHFRGFDEYFSIPYGDKDARGGHWEKGPGIDLFRKIEQALGWKQVIAEDLGYMTDSVRHLVYESGFPGMKVLEFAFDSRDSGCASDYLPHNYPENCVAYTGTHDNETIVGWWKSITAAERKLARDYLCDHATPEEELYKCFISLIMRSAARVCVIPMQDYMGLDNRFRMNKPSTVGMNWKWRIKKRDLTKKLQKEIYDVTLRYGRKNWD